MENTTENDYLEMASHAKQLIERKERIIYIYKTRLDDIDSELRSMAYLISNLQYLMEYKCKSDIDNCKKNIDKSFNSTFKYDLCKLKNFVDTLRDMSELTSDDEEIAILSTY